MKLSYNEALANTTKNKLAKFPDRKSGRLEPSAEPSFHCGIVLEPKSRVMTMGSCFARNIEEYLAETGYDVPVLGFNIPAEEMGEQGRPQGILNKYTVASIHQEIKWVHELICSGEVPTWDSVKQMAYQTADGGYLDLQLSTYKAVSKERFLERRRQIFDVHKLAFDCDLFIITPGLTETWFDEQTGQYIQNMPDKNMNTAFPGRFSFVNLDFFQCHKMLCECADLLTNKGAKQIAFTVSPVPLARTMTSNDVLIANTYSKSTIRSAVGLICQNNERIKYIPSYEKVMLTKSAAVWEGDLRHVAGGVVGSIISSFVSGAGQSIDDISSMIIKFNEACDRNDEQEANAMLARIGHRAFESGMPDFHLNAANLLFKSKRYDDSLRHSEILRKLRSVKAVGYIRAASCLRKLGRHSEALAVLDDARARCDEASQKWIDRAYSKIGKTGS